MDNGPAMKENFAHNLQATGDVYGDPFEVSTMRKEDHEVIKDKSGEFVDILQLPHLPAARIRGHQYAGAFLQAVSVWKIFFQKMYQFLYLLGFRID